MEIAVAGIGYVGLSNAVLLAQNNHVLTYDIDSKRTELVNKGKSPVFDRDIEEYLSKDSIQSNLLATDDIENAINKADLILIATPTNYDVKINQFDTSSIEMIIAMVMDVCPDMPIIIKSTIPIGYVDKMREQYPQSTIMFAPEFLREGKALYDNLHPSRIVVGCDKNSEVCMEKAQMFVELMKEGALDKDVPTLITGTREAESIKLFANTYLAMRVGYFNELDTFAEMRGLDSEAIVRGVCLDPRIGMGYNNPSFGYGGYCLPKDTKQLLANYEDAPQVPMDIMRAIVGTNRTRKDYIAERILDLSGFVNGKEEENDKIIIGVYRLVMKAGSDNFRQSAIQGIMKRVKGKGVRCVVYEPLLEEDEFYHSDVIKDFNVFAEMSTLIIANRYDSELDEYKDKVYTRDILNEEGT